METVALLWMEAALYPSNGRAVYAAPTDSAGIIHFRASPVMQLVPAAMGMFGPSAITERS
jgi:hypothetical protein